MDRDCPPEPPYDGAGVQINTFRCGIPAYQCYVFDFVIIFRLMPRLRVRGGLQSRPHASLWLGGQLILRINYFYFNRLNLG